MCGIAGIINKNNAPVTASEIESLCNKINHRGPDGKGYYLYNNLAIGQTCASSWQVSFSWGRKEFHFGEAIAKLLSSQPDSKAPYVLAR
jgi:glutamate synthase domain-containing protein 1